MSELDALSVHGETPVGWCEATPINETVDEDGNPIVPPSDVGKLAELDAADSSYLYEECASHCGINRQDLDDLAKNSEPTPPSDSPTS